MLFSAAPRMEGKQEARDTEEDWMDEEGVREKGKETSLRETKQDKLSDGLSLFGGLVKERE